MIRRPPRSTRTDTLFPYTTLFRSVRGFAEPSFATKVRFSSHTRCQRASEALGLKRAFKGLFLAGGLSEGGAPQVAGLGEDRFLQPLDGAGAQFRVQPLAVRRSEARRVGTRGGRTVRTRWAPHP